MIECEREREEFPREGEGLRLRHVEADELVQLKKIFVNAFQFKTCFPLCDGNPRGNFAFFHHRWSTLSLILFNIYI